MAPLERLKLEYIIRGATKNAFDTVQDILYVEGLRGFWRGNVINLIRIAPFKSINFFSYDAYRKQWLLLMGKEELSNIERFAAGAAAGITATLMCFPMDTVCLRLTLYLSCHKLGNVETC